MPIVLSSPSFDPGSEIPARHTCKGEDRAPALQWVGVPRGTASLALIVDDPDAPDPRAPKITWVHWVLYNIPPSAGGLPEGGSPLPAGTREGLNDWKSTGYRGPCPPIGRHRYFHKLFALDMVLGDLGAPTKAALERAMEGHVIERGELMGVFEKP
jgi:Raf kinase inhibitor-like YbhB/YbcL family protein